ncbi:hypothetical protein [Neorickettsia findlayensis]|uniref:Uncharacterized protein n=1 Tax=Neorickettsia findlayensis TaxID=2686014 RepID=A0A6P1G9P8_9RICK|nr:hypothetical protein [Neorickettsia findlayensis]QHD64924.1 hypothetical protein GP480_00330 [Neorickettsia findlayensis]
MVTKEDRKVVKAIMRGRPFYVRYAALVIAWMAVVAMYAAVLFFDNKLGKVCGADGHVARTLLVASLLLAALVTFVVGSKNKSHDTVVRRLQDVSKTQGVGQYIKEEARQAMSNIRTELVLFAVALVSAAMLGVAPMVFHFAGVSAASSAPYYQACEFALCCIAVLTLLAVVYLSLAAERAEVVHSAAGKLGFFKEEPVPALGEQRIELVTQESSCTVRA